MNAIAFRPCRSTRCLGYRESQVLDFVRQEVAENGQAPSYGMICDALDIATKGEVSRIVAALERRGMLARVGRGRVRRIALRLVERDA